MTTAHAGPVALKYEDSVTRFATAEEAINRGIIVRYDKRSMTLIDGPNSGQTVEYWVPIFEIDGSLTVAGTVALDAPTLAALETIQVGNFPATQAVTGPLTDTQLRASAVPVSVSGTVPVSGPLTDTQLRATAVPVSGTVAVTGTFWQATQPISHASLPSSLGTKTAALSFPVTLPSNQIVPVNVVSLTPSNATSTAYESSRVVKNASGYLLGMTGFNSKSSAQWIHIHNLTAAPADGTAPAVIFYVPATSSWSLDFGVNGRFFSTGITITNSTTGPTKTIGVSDCWFDVQYI